MSETPTRRRVIGAPRKPVDIGPETEVAEEPIFEKPSWPELTDYEINECRKLANGLSVYKYENPNVPGEVFVFRPLRAREMASLNRQRVQGEPEFTHDERLASAAVLWPQGLGPGFWSNTVAGHAPSIALQVQEKSGFPIINPNGSLASSEVYVTLLEPTESEITSATLPTPEQVLDWRSSTLSRKLMVLDFSPDKLIYFRPLLRPEYHAILGKEGSNTDTALLGCKTATLWPEGHDWENEMAGVVERSYDALLELSGFNAQPVVQEL